jgi:ribosomal protein S18 acetylase RimI-like enzyme
MTGFEVRRVTADQASRAAPLFAGYLAFYGREYDEPAALDWLTARLERDESVVLLAVPDEGDPVGFLQLYPGFSSVGLRPAWVLNDLYVAESARGRGVAEALIAAAEQVARDAGCTTLSLETHHDNHAAQRLYRRLGWVEQDDYLAFSKQLGPDGGAPPDG